MKYTLLLIVLACTTAIAQKKVEPVKSDTLTIVAKGDKFPEIIETELLANTERIKILQDEIEKLKQQNEKYFQAILQINSLRQEDVIGTPAYAPKQLTFKVKKK